MGRVRVTIWLGVGFGLGFWVSRSYDVCCRRTIVVFAAYVRLSQRDNITNGKQDKEQPRRPGSVASYDTRPRNEVGVSSVVGVSFTPW